jgi:hypothetical protein
MLRTISYLSLLALTPLVACDTPVLDGVLDGDADGVNDDLDRCSATSPGTPVDAHGCDDVAQAGEQLVPDGTPDADLDGDGESRPSERLVAQPPRTGDVQNGFYPIVLDRGGEAPHVLHAHVANVDDGGETIDVDGDVTLATPTGFVLIEDAQLAFDRDADGEVVGVSGTAFVPMPGFALLDGVTAGVGARADVGYSPGADLDAGVPLREERSYLHFILESTAIFSAGDLVLSTDGPGAVVVIDPADPGIFLRGDLVGLGSLGPINDVAIGLSFQGLIPYEPIVTPATDSGVTLETFDGNVWLQGNVDVPGLPLVLLGDTVVSVQSPLTSDDTSATIGGNGSMDLVFEVFGIDIFEARLANASATVHADDEGVRAAWAGAPDELVFADALPLAGEASWMTGHASDDGAPEVAADATLVISGGWLTGTLFTPLPDIPLAAGELLVGADDIDFEAPLRTSLDIAGVKFGAGVDCVASFAHDASDFSIVIDGYTDVVFGPPQPATVTITPAGVVVE